MKNFTGRLVWNVVAMTLDWCFLKYWINFNNLTFYLWVWVCGCGDEVQYINVIFKEKKAKLTLAVIHLQFWAYESWDSLFPISMSPNCKLMSPEHCF